MTGVGAKIGGQTVLTDGEGAFAIYTDGVAGYISGKAQLDGLRRRRRRQGAAPRQHDGPCGRPDAHRRRPRARDPLRRERGHRLRRSRSATRRSTSTTPSSSRAASPSTAPATSPARGLLVFVGDGPLTLANGERNPLARGVVLRDATIGVVKTGADYALDARGTIELVGFEDITVAGHRPRPREHASPGAVNEVLTIPGTDLEVPVVFASNETRDATTNASVHLRCGRRPAAQALRPGVRRRPRLHEGDRRRQRRRDRRRAFVQRPGLERQRPRPAVLPIDEWTRDADHHERRRRRGSRRDRRARPPRRLTRRRPSACRSTRRTPPSRGTFPPARTSGSAARARTSRSSARRSRPTSRSSRRRSPARRRRRSRSPTRR